MPSDGRAGVVFLTSCPSPPRRAGRVEVQGDHVARVLKLLAASGRVKGMQRPAEGRESEKKAKKEKYGGGSGGAGAGAGGSGVRPQRPAQLGRSS